jgi:hypothetical protein
MRRFSSTPNNFDSVEEKKPQKKMIIDSYRTQRVSKPQTVLIDPNTKEVHRLTPLRRRSLVDYRNQFVGLMQDIYLPVDYPDSVAPQYLNYTVYSTIAQVSITTMQFLSTQACFCALSGTTGAGSTLASAALTWVMKDGIG